MRFEVKQQDERWMVSDGVVRFGPYVTKAKADASAASLNRQRAWSDLSLAELITGAGAAAT